MTLTDDLADLENYSCLVTIENRYTRDLLGLVFNHCMLNCRASEPSGENCIILGVSVDISFTSYFEKAEIRI